MICSCCGYEIELRPDIRVDDVCVTVSNDVKSECHVFK